MTIGLAALGFAAFLIASMVLFPVGTPAIALAIPIFIAVCCSLIATPTLVIAGFGIHKLAVATEVPFFTRDEGEKNLQLDTEH